MLLSPRPITIALGISRVLYTVPITRVLHSKTVDPPVPVLIHVGQLMGPDGRIGRLTRTTKDNNID